HVTFAEIPPDPKDYPGALPHMLFASSLVFTPPSHPIDLRDFSQWWTFLKGASWHHPYGPKSNIEELDDHPVVHIAYSDALAYAKWAGKGLPTEAGGSLRRAADSRMPNLPGAMSSYPTIARWRTRGRANSRSRKTIQAVTNTLRR